MTSTLTQLPYTDCNYDYHYLQYTVFKKTASSVIGRYRLGQITVVIVIQL